ncbi:DnaB-like helicase C-terminal domain-containing protein [Aeromonas caviae]|uniref:DnaB-like helicase C-terminal domain-containing protein n=1 Tax=Aeromonas caviae TaxID=648 RepID=UPI002B4A0313|nr:DnaB-like helicase C-terminal domain-containing protein [Aeromonas caviae]
MSKVYDVREYEERLLAPCLVNFTGTLRELITNMAPADMSCPQTHWLLGTYQTLIARGSPVELVTVGEYLTRQEQEAPQTLPLGIDWAWLVELAKNCLGDANAAWYANAIRQHAYQARLAANLRAMLAAADRGDDMAELTEKATALILEHDAATKRRKPALVSDCLQDVYEAWDDYAEGRLCGLMLPDGGLGEAFGEMRAGELVVVAGRPGSGKTELAVTVANEIAIKQRRATLYVSLEMDAHEMAERVWLASSGVSLNDAQSRLGDNQIATLLGRAATEIGQGQDSPAPFYVSDSASMAIGEITRQAADWCASTPNPAALIVDYVGLIELGNTYQRHDLAIGEITRSLKMLAKRLGVVVIALFQLSRDVEKRENKRPVAADLRDSGSIEQDADKIVMVYRDKAYRHDTPLGGLVELLNVKRRRGQPQHGYMNFINGHMAPVNDQEGAAEQVREHLTTPKAAPGRRVM